jgi:hypothetical protein
VRHWLRQPGAAIFGGPQPAAKDRPEFEKKTLIKAFV